MMNAEDLRKDSAKPAAKPSDLPEFLLDQEFEDGRERLCVICAATTKKFAIVRAQRIAFCAGHMNQNAAADVAGRLEFKSEK